MLRRKDVREMVTRPLCSTPIAAPDSDATFDCVPQAGRKEGAKGPRQLIAGRGPGTQGANH